MNQGELIAELRRRTGLTIPSAQAVLSALMGIIEEALQADDDIVLRDFGRLHTVHKKATTRPHPTGGMRTYPPSRGVHFSASPRLKERLNGGE